MTKHSQNDEQQTDQPADPGFVTRADIPADEKPTEAPKTVKLTGPGGTVIETAEENADTMRGMGFS